MSAHDDLVYVRPILGAIVRIQSYTENLTLAEFHAHPMAQDAVIRQFEIIGEATKRVGRPFRDVHVEIPWAKMAGMRDVLIHGYAWNQRAALTANELRSLICRQDMAPCTNQRAGRFDLQACRPW